MKILVDMNLSPFWIDTLHGAGLTSVHWSTVGDPRASDSTVMSYAREAGFVVLTHDLDFGALLALTMADGPSVFQMRMHDVLPSAAGPRVIAMLRRHEPQLLEGALVVVDEWHARVRILPLAR